MRLHADRAHAGAAAAVGNAEGLVQIEMADIGAVIAGARQADLRVEIGAVEIDLAAMAMHDVADLADLLLEHAMGRGIGDHDRRQRFRMRFGLGTQVTDVDIAAGVAGDHHDVHADHRGRGRIGAMGRGGDQADLAVAFAARGMIAADRKQPGIFALRARIRLQRDRVIAGDVAQPLFQPRKQRVIARGLLARRKRMQRGELRPGQRDHLGRRIQLHGAGAERDHRAVEREVAIAELAHIAQHLGLGAMRVEHWDGSGNGRCASIPPAAFRARWLRPRRKQDCRRRRAIPPRPSQAWSSRRARCRACAH